MRVSRSARPPFLNQVSRKRPQGAQFTFVKAFNRQAERLEDFPEKFTQDDHKALKLWMAARIIFPNRARKNEIFLRKLRRCSPMTSTICRPSIPPIRDGRAQGA
jgi:hypothetical protein